MTSLPSKLSPNLPPSIKRRRKGLLTAGLLVGLLWGSGSFPLATSTAAELNVADGVVIKFAADGQLVVRDKLVLGQGVTLTSQKDDTVGGQVNAAPQVAAAGDWRGVRFEKSAAAGLSPINDAAIRFAGGSGEAALSLRGVSPALQYVQITDSTTGLRLLNGASPAITGASFLRNATGIDADGNSSPVISSTQFAQNSSQAVINRTPLVVIQATGNWWGHASGPKDAVGNPQGQGDPVSTGVNYGAFLTAAPLLNPTVRLASPASFYEQRNIALDISCVNATEYRIAEGNAFAGVAFQPLPSGRASVLYQVSQGDGRKTINVQFRNASGTVASATVSGGVLIDTMPPAITISNPAPGSLITQPIVLEAAATDSAGIAKVEIYLDNQQVSTRTASPYTYNWDTTKSEDGAHEFKVVAYDQVGKSSQQTVPVTLARYVPPPDTDGPALANIAFMGASLTDGMTLSRNGNVTFTASDRSGISRIELLLDGQPVGVASGTNSYTVAFSLDNVANGPHTLGLRATDSLGNTSQASYSISVLHAVPDAPVIGQPVSGLVTRIVNLPVSGTAKAGNSIQMLNNGQPAGAAVTVGADGRFAATVPLVNGENRLQATAADQYGTSSPSAVVLVTLDTSVPGSPSNLTATSLTQGKVRLTWVKPTDANVTGFDLYRSATAFNAVGEAIKVNSSRLTANTFEDMPPKDGTWHYRVVSVNGVGTNSEPSNLVQAVSDATLPRAVSVVYSAQGKADAATGRYGQGRVGVVLTVSEALPSAPYLAIVPAGGGTPLVVDLMKSGETAYTGSFLIDAATPSGTATALFSARDAVGNRGTDIDAGATIKIDTDGPVLTGIALVPGAPIKNDPVQTLVGTFTLSKAVKPGTTPQIAYLLSGPVRTPVALVGLSAQGATTWRGSFTLPSDAGLGSPETLSFTFQGVDDLDNAGTKVTAANRFQVYQGELPPLGIPAGLTAKAQPGGKVKLDWQAVADAALYQLYRQGPGESSLQPLTRVGGLTHTDATPADGRYVYAIASVRQVNGQESVSGQSAPVEAVASATAPGAPQNLTLRLTGQGIVAEWQPPLASTVASYSLYRAGGTSLTSVAGLTPLKSGIKQPIALDPSPSSTQGAYAVTALDAAGNESAPSNSAYLNASLLPVANLKVEQIGTELPLLTWNAPNGNVAGYAVYLGPDSARIKLTAAPITAQSYRDTGYTAGERRYTVATVDTQGVEMPRSILLPAVSAQVVGGLPIKRGIMNKLQVQVTNTSAVTLENVRVVVRLPINREATQFQDHRSAVLALGPNQTQLVPVVVGGYPDLPAQAGARVGVEITPAEGEFIKIARDQTLDVGDGALAVGMATEEFTRGATGKVKLTIENTSEVDIELLTAINNGTAPSSELRFKLIDTDGNVLSTQPLKQSLGANVVTLTNGLTVARIPAGASYVSDAFTLTVPGASPASLRVRLEMDKIRYHSGQDDQVFIPGRGAEKTVSLVDTAYVGEVTEVTPINSFGDQDILITGRALDRASRAPLPNTRLKLVLNQQGFERLFEVLTDTAGSFIYTFKPTLSDAGLYKVSAIHPDMTDRPEQKAFTINRVTVTPTPVQLTVPRNYPYAVPFVARAGAGTAATNLRLALDGAAPAGVRLQLSAPVTLAERQSLNIPLTFTADNAAPASGTLNLDVLADEHPQGPLGRVQINYSLSEAKPYLVSAPSYIETGLAQGGSQIESITVENKGLQDALNLRFALTEADGATPAPAWVALASQADGTLAVGQKRAIDLNFTPPASLAEGVYAFKLQVRGDNVPSQSLNVYVSITQSGQGNALFKVSDIYTATVDKQGRFIPGLAGATLTVQNEDVATVRHQLVTDSQGEAYFQNLPAGRYQYRAQAANHQETGGRFQVKPGVTFTQPVFLDYNLVQVEWSVREVTIQDRYEITLNTTFETDVPAAVLVMQPASVNLPLMKAGDVFYGELTLQNYGLVRADHLKVTLPPDDEFFKYEFLMSLPPSLAAKQRLTIPYRITALKSLDQSGTASGGGCFSYSSQLVVAGEYACANGEWRQCGTRNYWVSASSSTCGGGGGGSTGWSGGSWGGGGGGFGGGSSGGYQTLSGVPSCVKCGGKCCTSSHGAGAQ